MYVSMECNFYKQNTVNLRELQLHSKNISNTKQIISLKPSEDFLYLISNYVSWNPVLS